MKGLMFLLSGAVLHACHTKDLERLGGLGKRMPATFALMVVGGVAIAGLPPLNAFVSEWLLYNGLMHGALRGQGAGAVACVLAVAFLSMVGALAALCFVRLIGVSMLGEPRSAAAEKAHEASLGMLLPTLPLGVLIVVQAVFAQHIFRFVRPVLDQLTGNSVGSVVANLGLESLSRLNLILFALLCFAVFVSSRIWGKSRISTVGPTWDCGYAAPTAKIQYTARGISELFTTTLLPKRLSPKLTQVLPEGVFSQSAVLDSDTHDPLTRDVYEPFFAKWADRFARLRWMQQGQLHIYLLYILTTLLIALAFSVIY
jgi:NADH:ubiquinone oxidoreductase subunit 5 (subunit L)/multisubunit Na+/H+ antiporter MnhA subunit